MERLILFRHGRYNGSLELSDEGRQQMEVLAEKIRPELSGGKRALILSSTAPRARQSAEVVGGILELAIELHEVLWSDNDHVEDFDATLALIQDRQEEADVLILVSHLEYVEDFPRFFGRKVLDVPVQSMDPGYAEGCIIDCASKTVRLLTHRA